MEVKYRCAVSSKVGTGSDGNERSKRSSYHNDPGQLCSLSVGISFPPSSRPRVPFIDLHIGPTFESSDTDDEDDAEGDILEALVEIERRLR